ncbi:hypothetical protein QTP70_013111 [Hemibagrus guttatus]|uniref:Anaphase-promoting complex subunit CDC26 n=1 Tax=Hemibagrus guttatus TaxID=175788 RepID=A0AAE0UKK0_9TELE|nr:hypothetical protein QTP70_013111 [Hemibagrus guttatus]KAK3526837.1 hypothetical protein QTP86_000700 [Hemibagrus guttatus]
MLRRKPTRLELKLDDIEEFESVKKELESRKKQRDEVDVVTPSEMSSSVGGSDGKTREQTIHERIGYKPHPKSNTLPSFFGNLQF